MSGSERRKKEMTGMRTLGWTAMALGGCLAVASRGAAQETFSLTPPVESTAFPNLEADGIIEGNVGEMFEFTGNIALTSAGLTGDEGPQGWSLGISNAGVEILSTTVDGTVSADSTANPPGMVTGGFVVNDLIDPAKKGNNGRMG